MRSSTILLAILLVHFRPGSVYVLRNRLNYSRLHRGNGHGQGTTAIKEVCSNNIPAVAHGIGHHAAVSNVQDALVNGKVTPAVAGHVPGLHGHHQSNNPAAVPVVSPPLDPEDKEDVDETVQLQAQSQGHHGSGGGHGHGNAGGHGHGGNGGGHGHQAGGHAHGQGHGHHNSSGETSQNQEDPEDL